jgi:hypothetical protein
MTRTDKLLIRFLSKPHDFRFTELKRLLQRFGYREVKTGKTTGSRVAFFHESAQHIIRLHKPQAKNALKRYQIDLIEEELKNRGLIK